MADLYVSMSEHEGFGKPLVESMYLGVPILAYASSGVAETLGEAGILFKTKDYEVLAEMTDLMIQSAALRQKLVTREAERVQTFLAKNVADKWRQTIESLNL